MTLGHRFGHAHREYGDEIVESESTAIHEPYAVAQIVVVAIGVFFAVIGGIALARTGTRSWTGRTTTVAGMGSTTLLAVIHVGIGVILLLCAMSRSSARAAGSMFGAALIALGIVALAQPVRQMAWSTTSGVIYLLAGIAAIIGAVVTPVAAAGEERIMRSGESRYVA